MKKYLFIVLTAAILASCQSKESYIKDFYAFIEDVKAECDEYTLEDWEKADKKFADELSLEEKMEIAKCQTAYAAMKAKAGIKNLGKDIQEAAKKLDEAMKEE